METIEGTAKRADESVASLRRLAWRRRVLDATVTLPAAGGRGVLVPGGFVVTAAHCVHWDGRGGMALGDDYLERVVTAAGEEFGLAVCAVDPVSDVALLSSIDDQRSPTEAQAFEGWLERTRPVRVRGWSGGLRAPAMARQVPIRGGRRHPIPPLGAERARPSIVVHLPTLAREWVSGRVINFGNHSVGTAFIEGGTPIASGMSGGPIVDSRGHLLAVVSNAADQTYEGTLPILEWALPRWAWCRIIAAQSGADG